MARSVVTLRLDDRTRRRIDRIAKRRGSTASEVIRTAIDQLVEVDDDGRMSVYDLTQDLLGSIRGGNPQRSMGGGRRVAALLRARRRGSR